LLVLALGSKQEDMVNKTHYLVLHRVSDDDAVVCLKTEMEDRGG
jgi:hypothetical protein